MCCFGVRAESRTGWLCPTCRHAVGVQYKQNPELTFEDRVDNGGKHGAHGHRKQGFKRRPALGPVSTNHDSTSTGPNTITTPVDPEFSQTFEIATPYVNHDHVHSTCKSFQSPISVTSTSRLNGNEETPVRWLNLTSMKRRTLDVRVQSHSPSEHTQQVEKRVAKTLIISLFCGFKSQQVRFM